MRKKYEPLSNPTWEFPKDESSTSFSDSAQENNHHSGNNNNHDQSNSNNNNFNNDENNRSNADNYNNVPSEIDSHFQMYGKHAYEVEYGERCPLCNKRIDEYGYCACGSGGE
jgi:hypothetical protein